MRIIFFLMFLILNGCKSSPTIYKGYVYHENKPLVNVSVIKEYAKDRKDSTLTDSTGYFELQKEPNSLVSLIFIKEHFRSETIPSVWTQHGEKVKYTFLNKVFDTVRLKKSTVKQ